MPVLPDPPIGGGHLYLPVYENLDDIVGRLKRAAIDAYMCGGTLFNLVGNHYENQSNTSRWVSRPDEYGRGGGVPSHEGEDWGDSDDIAADFAAEFERISGEIDDLVDKWRDLPDPGVIHQQVERWEAVFAAFDECRYDGGDDALVSNALRLRDFVNGDPGHHTPELLVGTSADAFKEYVNNLYAAVATCRNITLVTGRAMAAQEGLWKASRENVVGILVNTIDVLDKIALRDPDRDLGTVFTVAGIVATVVGCFTAGVGTVAVAGVSITLGLLGPVTTDEDRSKRVDRYSDALTFVGKLLNNDGFGLGGRIRREEENIQQYIRGIVDEINNHRAVFDPRPGPIESTVDINRPEPWVTESIYSLMSDISGALGWVRDQARASAIDVGFPMTMRPGISLLRGPACMLSRHSGIGIGRTGPADDFQDLADLIGNVVIELSWEVGEGERNLRAAMNLLDQSESDAAATLNQVSAEFAAGYHGDGQ